MLYDKLCLLGVYNSTFFSERVNDYFMLFKYIQVDSEKPKIGQWEKNSLKQMYPKLNLTHVIRLLGLFDQDISGAVDLKHLER